MTRKTDRERAIDLDTLIAELLKKKRELDVKFQDDERKKITRQNIIVGGYLRQHQPDVFNKVVDSLSRSQDLKAFE